MAKKEFKFLEAYRTRASAASRDVVEARLKAHRKLYPLVKDMEKLYDLCRISFRLPFDRDAVAWFEETIREEDSHFSLDIDKAEASLVATLVLRDCISNDDAECPLACLAVSYCGKREPGDGGSLLTEARDALDAAGNGRRIIFAEKKIALPAGKDLKAELDAVEGTFQAPTVHAAFKAISSDSRDSTGSLAASVNDAIASLNSDSSRLAEEVDMLWWYIGDWSEPLGKPRSALEPAATAVTSAAELGDLVREVPGPHGVYGILRRALGPAGNAKTSLQASIKQIAADDLSRLVRPLTSAAQSLFPVQAAINLVAERGVNDCVGPLNLLLGDVPAMEISYYELAVQMFRERVLIGYGGLGR